MKTIKTCNLLKELRAFCVTYQQGSMSKAADILCASQPTVSLQIKKLESELGVTLFERCGPKLSITTEGEILYNIATPLVNGFDHIKEEFKSQNTDLVSGDLNIAAEESTLLSMLPNAIETFIKEYPGIRLKISNIAGQDGRQLVMNGDADLAVSSMLTTPTKLNYIPLATYPIVLITPLNHPLTKIENITIEDIAKHNLVLPPTHYSSWRLIKMVFDLQGETPRTSLEAGGWEVIKLYVSKGIGVSIVTSICITEEDKQNLAIIPLNRYFPNRIYGVVTKKDRRLSMPAQRFIEILNNQGFK